MQASHLFAGIAVADFEAGLRWYERVFGKPPDMLPAEGDSVWHLASNASVYVVRDAERAGKALVTLAVRDLEHLMAELAARDVPDRAIQQTPGPMLRLIVTDAEGNRVTFFEDPGTTRRSVAD
jgi:catechol 2,3-dioxygenase-like lactoylglutathione lyase family enzyme